MAQGIVAIAGGGLRAEISEQGAELQSLRDDAGAKPTPPPETVRITP